MLQWVLAPTHGRSSRLRSLPLAQRNRNTLNLCIVFDQSQSIGGFDSRFADAR